MYADVCNYGDVIHAGGNGASRQQFGLLGGG